MVDACDRLSLERPVLQAAMGGVARHDLVVAVSQAGGLGTLSYLPPAFFAEEIKRVEETLGQTPYAINLLLPIITRAHIEACLASRAPIVSLFYGFDADLISALKAAGKLVLFQVGSLAEARKVIAAGADGLIVQGHEAGGHVRGTQRLADVFARIREAFPETLLCAAGGIYDRQSAEGARALGADAVASGTRFLATPEAAAHQAYKQRLIEARETVITQLFGVGWRDPHRVIPNGAVRKWCDERGHAPAWLAVVHAVLGLVGKVAGGDGGAALTARQSLKSPLYTPASLTPEMEERLIECVALYAGEGVQHISALKPAAQIVEDLSP